MNPLRLHAALKIPFHDSWTPNLLKSIAFMFLVVFTQQVAHGGPALDKFVETDAPIEVWGRGSSYECSLPPPVFSEILRENCGFLLGFLSKAASAGGRQELTAKELIVVVLYFSAQVEAWRDRRLTAEMLHAKSNDQEVKFDVPNLFSDAIRQGFPKDPNGWRQWFFQVQPRLLRFAGSDPNAAPCIWVLNVRGQRVSAVLESVGKELGVKVFYSAPQTGDPEISIQAAGVSLRDLAFSLQHYQLKLERKEDGIHIGPMK